MCSETPSKSHADSLNCNPMRVRGDVLASKRKRRRDSVEVLFLLSSGFYLITLALPLFLYRSLDLVDDYKSRVIRGSHQQKRRVEKQLYSRKPYHLRPNKHVGASTKRVFFLDETSSNQYTYDSFKQDKQMEASDSLFLQYRSVDNELQNDSNECVPMAKWQTTSFPTCNMFHEIDLFFSSRVLSYDNQRVKNRLHFISNIDVINASNKIMQHNHTILGSHKAKLLGNGWFRHAWKVTNVDHGVDVAMKTLRLDREYLPEYYELHRREAIAMERLTASPYVMDMYGYCGNSAMTELAFGEKGIDNLYRLAVGLKDNFSPYVLQTKLQIAAMTAMGLSHIHNIPGEHESHATIAHYDFNPRNIIISASGTPKINDFNCAEFLTWNEKTQSPCGFEARLHEPWWRAPEEMILQEKTNTSNVDTDVQTNRRINEKVDVYSLGNVLFVLLTGLEPHGKAHKKLRYKNVTITLASGEMPALPIEYAESQDPIIAAIRIAILKCWEHDPNKRAGSAHIAQVLYNALADLKHQDGDR